jgi:hypothetical protein
MPQNKNIDILLKAGLLRDETADAYIKRRELETSAELKNEISRFERLAEKFKQKPIL